MKKCVIISDSFKGTLSSRDICLHAAAGTDADEGMRTACCQLLHADGS